MSNVTQQPVSKPKPVRMLLSIAAASTAVAGGLPLLTPDSLDWIGPACGLLGLVLTVAVGTYTEGQVVPVQNVAVQRNDETGDLVAGKAAAVPTGTVVEEPVAAGESPYGPSPAPGLPQ